MTVNSFLLNNVFFFTFSYTYECLFTFTLKFNENFQVLTGQYF